MASNKRKSCPHCGSQYIDLSLVDEGYFCFCSDCGTSGPWEKTANKATTSWNNLPRTLVWNKKRPKDGWYWLRSKDGQTEIVDVDRSRYVIGKSYGTPLDHEDFYDADWAGPINAPVEEKQ